MVVSYIILKRKKIACVAFWAVRYSNAHELCKMAHSVCIYSKQSYVIFPTSYVNTSLGHIKTFSMPLESCKMAPQGCVKWPSWCESTEAGYWNIRAHKNATLVKSVLVTMSHTLN